MTLKTRQNWDCNLAQGFLSSSKYNSQQNRSQTSKGGSTYITRAVNNATVMNWDSGSSTGWDAAVYGGNPLSPEWYQSGFRWGNGATDLGNYVGLGYSVNRYVSMTDYSTGGGQNGGRYDGAPNAVNATSDFNYRHDMSGEHGGYYGRDTKTTCPKMKLFHSFYLYIITILSFSNKILNKAF